MFRVVRARTHTQNHTDRSKKQDEAQQNTCLIPWNPSLSQTGSPGSSCLNQLQLGHGFQTIFSTEGGPGGAKNTTCT
jgi:hypothetical protein